MAEVNERLAAYGRVSSVTGQPHRILGILATHRLRDALDGDA